MKALMEKLAELEKKNGRFDDAILIDDAHHACNPYREYEWKAPAIMKNTDGTFDLGWVKWDFEEWIEGENDGKGAEDPGSYPWEGNCEFKAELEGCTMEDKAEIESWIGS